VSKNLQETVKESYAVFWLQTCVIDHLCTHLGTTSNYSSIENLHISQITTAPVRSFPACCVVTSRSLAKASNSGDSSASPPLFGLFSYQKTLAFSHVFIDK
jgi:hypothetical protein